MAIKMTAPLEVGLGVQDLPRMRGFYEELLNCSFISEVEVASDKSRQAGVCAEGYKVVRLQTTYGERIKLLAPLTKDKSTKGSNYILDGLKATYLTFIVDDIDAVIDRLHSLGIELLTGPNRVEVRPGTFIVFFRDPEGHLVEIVQYADVTSYRNDLADGKAAT